MIEILLDDNVPRVQIGHIIGFVIVLTGKVCFSLILVPIVFLTTSFSIVIISEFLSRVLLNIFEHTVLLKMVYFIIFPALYINVPFWASGWVSLLFSFKE